MSKLDKETIVQKQCQNKYDMKNRRKKEQRTARISLRCTPQVKEQFENNCRKSRKSQSDVFEEMVQKNKVVEIPYAKEASRQLCGIYNELDKLRLLIKNQDIPGAAEYIEQKTHKVENISKDLFYSLKNEVL